MGRGAGAAAWEGAEGLEGLMGFSEGEVLRPMDWWGNRIHAKKGDIFDVWQVVHRTDRDPQRGYVAEMLRPIGPTGVAENDLRMIDAPGGHSVFEAVADGDYYVELSPGMPPSPDGKLVFHTEVRKVETIAAKPTDDQTFTIEPSELKLLEFPVKPDQIVRTSIAGPVQFSVTGPVGKVTDGQSAGAGPDQEGYGNTACCTWFKPNIDNNQDVIRGFHGDGAVRVAIRSNNPSTAKAAFKNRESLPEWQDGVPVRDKLNIGDSRLFLLKSTKSELMRVNARADQFVVRLDIFRMNGELANSLSNRTSRSVGDDLYFPEPGTFLVRLSCEGNGGSGEFEMKRETPKPVAYKLGSVQTMTLKGDDFGLYSVNLEEGKTYRFMVDNPRGGWLSIDLVDDDGQFLTSQRIGFDTVTVHYFRPTRSGRHRLWLRGGVGVWHFEMELFKSTTVGAEAGP